MHGFKLLLRSIFMVGDSGNTLIQNSLAGEGNGRKVAVVDQTGHDYHEPLMALDTTTMGGRSP